MSLRTLSFVNVAILASILVTQILAYNPPKPIVVKAVANSPVVLSCPFRGDAVWWKNGEPFFPKSKRVRVKNGYIKIMKVQFEDRGEYKCRPWYDAGREFTIVLYVK